MNEKIEYATNTIDQNENPDREVATLSPEEEKRLIRKIDWKSVYLLFTQL